MTIQKWEIKIIVESAEDLEAKKLAQAMAIEGVFPSGVSMCVASAHECLICQSTISDYDAWCSRCGRIVVGGARGLFTKHETEADK